MFSSFVTRRGTSGEQIKARFAEHKACKYSVQLGKNLGHFRLFSAFTHIMGCVYPLVEVCNRILHANPLSRLLLKTEGRSRPPRALTASSYDSCWKQINHNLEALISSPWRKGSWIGKTERNICPRGEKTHLWSLWSSSICCEQVCIYTGSLWYFRLPGLPWKKQ